MLQEKVANQATLLMGPGTEEKLEPIPFHQEVELPAPLPETEQPQHAPALAKDRTEKMNQHQPGDGQHAPPLHVPAAPFQNPRYRVQPTRMTFIGILLTLLIISGGFAAYLHLLPTLSVSSTLNSEATTTAISRATETPPPQHQTSTPPVAVISPAIRAGGPIYGTQQPFSLCDKQGGHWTNADAQVTCTSDGSKIVNTSGHLAIANLDQLTGNHFPWPSQNFIVQVEVTIDPNAHGAFGIAFQPQTNSQEYFAYLLNPSGNWTFSHYDASSNVIDQLVPGQLLSSVSTKLTIDIRVEGTNYSFYVNGKDTGDLRAILVLSGL